MTDTSELLRQYVKEGSEQAFRELVDRNVDLVYSTALRRVGGDVHLAQDITQTVFTDLARKAAMLVGQTVLGGWLYRDTCFRAAQTIRTDRRRRAREQTAAEMNALHDDIPTAWKQLAPVLDDAVKQLSGSDRDAIVLRFFERRDLRAVGAALGTNEDAAQKRVSRALEKLRSLLVKKGITLSVATLATLLADAVVAAPGGLAAAAATSALAGATGTGVGLTILKFMTMTKLKAGALSALVVAGVATPLVLQYQAQSKLRDKNEALQFRLSASEAEAERLLKQRVPSNSTTVNDEQFRELLKLRGQVGQLRSQTNDLEKLRAENQQLRGALAKKDQNPRGTVSPPEANPPAEFPRESWSHVGYAEPHLALQSLIWALSNGDVTNGFAGLTAEQRVRWEERMTRNNQSVSEVAAAMAKDFENTKRYSILGKEWTSDNEVVLRLKVEGERTPDTVFEQKARMIKVGDDWKFAGWANPKK